MYQGKAGSACSFLSLPGTGRSSGCQWDGVARRGGGLSPESFPSTQRRGSHRLTHLCLVPGTAAWQLRLFGVTAVPPRRGALCTPPPVAPTRGRFGVKQPLGTPVVALAMPAPMCSQPHQHVVAWLSLAPAHACHRAVGPRHRRTQARRMWHTGAVTASRRGDRGGTQAHMAHPISDALPPSWGVTRTWCPCTAPWPGRLVQGSWCRIVGTP